MSYSHPCKKIVDASDLSAFRRSIAYSNIQEAIHSILVLVKSHELPRGILNLKLVSALKCEHATETYTIQCPNGQRVLNSLAYFDSVIENFPPLPGPRRFGNYAFRDWYGQLEDSAAGKLQELDILNTNKAGFLSELSYYFVAAFGSGIRLDFGTGHELSFVAFIGSLLKADALKNITGQDILVIFARYYDLVRRLILTYSLEPAGSHGVWGLDDHFHFIYILGAAQFNEPVSRYAPPVSQCLNEGTISEFLDTNLYINALAFIQKIKSGPFKNHSPLIYDIHTSVTLWKKVLSGLLKMYDVEVLGKFPVVQHFWFGGVLYPWKDENLKDLPVKQEAEKEKENVPTKVLPGVPSTGVSTGAPWKERQNSTRAPAATGPSPRAPFSSTNISTSTSTPPSSSGTAPTRMPPPRMPPGSRN